MKRLLLVTVAIAGEVVLFWGVACWVRHDTQWLASFDSLGELKASDVGGSVWETAFRQNGMDYVGVRYHRRKLPPRFVFFWLGPLSEPCLIFDGTGKRVDGSRNYNDDGLFVRRWPALFCGRQDAADTAGSQEKADGGEKQEALPSRRGL